MIIDEFKTTCTLLEKRRVPDGEGGWYVTWIDGPQFEAAIVMNTTTTARVAEREGMAPIYTVTTERNMPLDFHDVFRRESDGDTFRVTSDAKDVQTPDRASFQFAQVTAEKWALTDDE